MAFYVRLIFCGQNDLSNHGSVQKKNRKNPNVYNNNKGVYSLIRGICLTNWNIMSPISKI